MSIKLEYATSAACNVESVWQAFAEVERWPEWSKLFSRATWIEGPPWGKDSALLLEVSQPSARVRSTVTEVAAPSRAAWAGSVMGVTIKHNFSFTPQPDGKTGMRSDIELTGPATFFINEDMKKKGLETFTQWFDAMRDHAERLAAAERLSAEG